MTQVDERRTVVVSRILLSGSVIYALCACAYLPHRLSLADAIDVFLSGVIPGLVVTLLFWLARPGAFGPSLRRVLVGVSVSGAASVALLPLLALAVRL